VINTAGARLIFISPEEKIEDIGDKIDGFLISGGRDIDPEIYG
jgi:putative glutamine amidotransferase